MSGFIADRLSPLYFITLLSLKVKKTSCNFGNGVLDPCFVSMNKGFLDGFMCRLSSAMKLTWDKVNLFSMPFLCASFCLNARAIEF